MKRIWLLFKETKLLDHARKAMQEAKVLAREIRKDIQEAKNS